MVRRPFNEGGTARVGWIILTDVNKKWVTGRRYLTIEKECSGEETEFRQITENLRHPIVENLWMSEIQ